MTKNLQYKKNTSITIFVHFENAVLILLQSRTKRKQKFKNGKQKYDSKLKLFHSKNSKTNIKISLFLQDL